MRKIAGPGAVGNVFTDYNAISNPNGTVYTADYGNDVQDEILGVQDYAGIAESAGTNLYVLSALKKLTIDFSKHVGELFYLDSLKVAAAFDKDNPDLYFNGICLDAINVSEDIDVANWPDMVPHLRAKGITYNEGISGEKSSFDVTDWDITANVATLTFANTTAEIAILTALLEDNLVHGSFASWRSITLAGAIGDIPAGEYAITAIDTSLRTVKFAFTATNNSGSGAFTINFYTNRVPGSTTTARLYEATARTLVSANDDDGEVINGLRRRDRFQGHRFYDGIPMLNTGVYQGLHVYGFTTNETPGVGTNVIGAEVAGSGIQGLTSLPQDDTVNGAPRTGKTTDPRSLNAHIYIHGRSFI